MKQCDASPSTTIIACDAVEIGKEKILEKSRPSIWPTLCEIIETPTEHMPFTYCINEVSMRNWMRIKGQEALWGYF